ncbi:COQ9-domain-containing protein [Cladorrhinum samala]|uniref:Ubiquinone biosynthesis protein n=1 Tax=Cladorrhinum samala TaxID=585594 RepID=A0AAV9HTK1_9PEZI|nr:COQ9-domain-containing protein [Cladorrhinum samala]
MPPTPTGAASAVRRISTLLVSPLLRAGPSSVPRRTLTTTTLRTSPSPRISQIPKRTYHSTTHPPPPGPFTPAELSLLSSAYAHVPLHGFSPASLALGARDQNLLDISPSFLSSGDPAFSLIHYHLYNARNALASKKDSLFQGTEAVMTVEEKVEALTWARLKSNEKVIGKWQEALAILAMPSYAPTAVKELALLADEIYHLAGDLSVDPSWYTKRASLSAIYAASELFMTTDASPGFQETRAFLRRRLDEAATAGGAVKAVGQYAGFTASAVVNILRSKGVSI